MQRNVAGESLDHCLDMLVCLGFGFDLFVFRAGVEPRALCMHGERFLSCTLTLGVRSKGHPHLFGDCHTTAMCI